jgi:hypothetical protein
VVDIQTSNYFLSFLRRAQDLEVCKAEDRISAASMDAKESPSILQAQMTFASISTMSSSLRTICAVIGIRSPRRTGGYYNSLGFSQLLNGGKNMAEREYVSVVARELGRHAVWQPGLPLNLGDYGRISGGTFVKLGNIADFSSIPPLKSTSAAKLGWSFTSSGVRTAFLKGKADGGVGSAKLQIECGKKQSLLIRSANSRVEQVDNLQQLADALQIVDRWKSRWKVVRELRVIKNGLVLLSKSDGGTIELSGRLDEIQGLEEVGVKADAGIRISGDTSDTYMGISGPILLGLVRIVKNPWWGDPVKDLLGQEHSQEKHARIEDVTAGSGLADDPEESL